MQQQPRAAHNFDSVAALLASSGAGERSTPQRQSVSRNAALLLELRLIDAPALAPGSLLAAVQEQLQTWSITAQQQLKQDVQHDRTPTQASTTLAELLQTRLAPWQARLADIAQQLAQQVSQHSRHPPVVCVVGALMGTPPKTATHTTYLITHAHAHQHWPGIVAAHLLAGCNSLR